MIKFTEAGYTPANLKMLLKFYDLSREDVAMCCGVSLRAVHRWCNSTGSKGHRDMPLIQWEKLLKEAPKMRARETIRFLCSSIIGGTFRNPLQPGEDREIKFNRAGAATITAKLSESRIEIDPSVGDGWSESITIPVHVCVGEDGHRYLRYGTRQREAHIRARMLEIEREREMLACQHNGISAEADDALDLASQSASRADINPYLPANLR